MKKKEKYNTMNSQEDEDGYILYPDEAVVYENEKMQQDLIAGNGYPNKQSEPLKTANSGMAYTHPAILRRTAKK